MSEDRNFLARWSRLKQQSRAPAELPIDADNTSAALAPGAAVPAPEPAQVSELPPVDSLDFESDFSGFMQREVEVSVKRAALKKLFHTPHFNQMDGLDVYIDDYNSFEPIPESMLRELHHARGMIFDAPDEESVAQEVRVPAVDESGSRDEQIAASAASEIEDLPAESPSAVTAHEAEPGGVHNADSEGNKSVD